MRFNEARFAREYDTRLRQENYPGELLEIVGRELPEKCSLIDCGAGSGFFTVPLAKMGFRIIAIEPSAEMAGILREKLKREEQNLQVKIFEESWEEWEGEGAEALICTHALYGMPDAAKAIHKMIRLSERRIILIKNPHIVSGTLAEKIRMRLNKTKTYSRRDIDVARILDSSKIPYIVRNLEQIRISRFDSIEEEAAYYCYHLKLEDERKDEVMFVLREEAQYKNSFYEIALHYYDQIYIF